MDFVFSPVAGDSVDLFNPVQGVYGPVEERGVSPTDINTFGVFFEDALQVTDRFSVVTGVRYEQLHLRRQNFNAAGMEEASGFTRNFDSVGWRIGGVYSLTPNVNVYGQYSNAQDPANSNIFLVNAGEDFDLTDAEQWEVGLKASNIDDSLNFTITYFDIERDDVTERAPGTFSGATNVGGRESNGFEAAINYAPISYLDVAANISYVDAEFSDSANLNTGVLDGNTPPNVPEWTANAWVNVRPFKTFPVEFGAWYRYVDDREASNANDATLKDYSLLDLTARYKVTDKIDMTARIRNVTDEDYVEWSDIFYFQQTDPSFPFANQLLLGEPRSYEVNLTLRY